MLTGHTEGKKKGQWAGQNTGKRILIWWFWEEGRTKRFIFSINGRSENTQTLMSQKYKPGKWQGVLVKWEAGKLLVMEEERGREIPIYTFIPLHMEKGKKIPPVSSISDDRDGVTKKSCCSFRFCPNCLPPPPPILDNLYNFFPTSKFKIWKSV